MKFYAIQSTLTLTLLFSVFSTSCSKAPVTPSFGKKDAADAGNGGKGTPGTSKGGGGSTGGGGGEDDEQEEEINTEDPAIKAKAKAALELTDEFKKFTEAADKIDLKSIDNAGQVPALVIKSQAAIAKIMKANGQAEVARPKGRCVVFVSGDKALTDKDVAAPDFALSVGGKFLYSVSSEREASECQKLLKEKFAERYKTDFFNLHAVFYGVR